jgi:PLP dependent protein
MKCSFANNNCLFFKDMKTSGNWDSLHQIAAHAVSGEAGRTGIHRLLRARLFSMMMFAARNTFGSTTLRQPMIPRILTDNIAAAELRIAEACRRAGRERSEVTLVAVTKTVSAEIAGYLPMLGIRNLGENRPQELERKAALLDAGVNWHMIGHLQRNKVERVTPLACLIHSVDSARLLRELDRVAEKQGRTIAVFLEVNISGEPSKQGFAPSQLPGVVAVLAALGHLHVRGLMTMAAFAEPEASRPTFTRLRELRDYMGGELAPPHVLEHLSMGMSNDFEIAIEEGATFIRLGTALFEGLTAQEP